MGTLMGTPGPSAVHAGPPMAESDGPARRDPGPAGSRTQPCRPVPRVHAFGKGEQALRRDPHTAPAMQGWLHKQDSSGLRLWKRRWFVLVDLCLYYYRDSSEQQVRGGLPLPGYEIRVLPASPRGPRAPPFLFTAEHPGMRTYCLGAETPEELQAWVRALRRGASPLPRSPHSLSQRTLREPRGADPPSPPLPTHSPAEKLGGPPAPPARCPPVPALPHSQAPSAEEPPPERDIGTNQPPASPSASPDWLPIVAEPSSAAPAPPSNEASRRRRAGRGGRVWAREGVAGRPIRITLLRASF